MNSEDGQVYSAFVYCNFLVLLSTTVCSQNINKQNVNIADETLTDYIFLSSYHYTKSKNYLKRQYRIRHWIPMFIGTPCMGCKFALIPPKKFDIKKCTLILRINEFLWRTKNCAQNKSIFWAKSFQSLIDISVCVNPFNKRNT